MKYNCSKVRGKRKDERKTNVLDIEDLQRCKGKFYYTEAQMETWFRYRILFYATIIAIPVVLVVFDMLVKNKNTRFVYYNEKMKRFLVIGYIVIILYFTMFRRTPGPRMINLKPFWSYALMYDIQYRWQIYMNVLLFFPLGFLIPYAMGQNLRRTILVGAVLSIIIEIVQYIWGLGLCELDDVFDNTLGTSIGYGYWKMLNYINGRWMEKFTKEK